MQTLKLTKKYETYPEYKNSGVEWLGKVPKDWNYFKLRNVLRSNIVDGPHETPKYAEEGIPFISVDSIEDVENVNLDVVKKFITDEQYIEYNKKTKLTKNDILFTKAASIGRVAIVDNRKFMTWSPLAIIKPNEKSIYYKYLFYVLKSNKFIESVVNSCSFNTQLNIGMKVLEKSMIGVPKDFLEQQKIANYLDEKTKNIDQIIEKKQKLIELLREKRTAVINHSVNNVKGNIEKLKYIAPERKFKLDRAPENVKYIGLEHIESNTGKIIDSGENTDPESSVNVFNKNDVLFGKLRPYLAKVFSPDFDGVCSGEFLVLVPKPQKILSRFLFYKLISKDFIKAVNDSTYGTKMPRANWQFIGNQFVKFPSINEQQKIIDLLDSKTELFSKIIKQVEKSVETLQEFKSSLISNVVTGKIKIK